MIIQRDRFGYGLTVSGDNPVYVLSVREGGAAHRAGIHMNDQIIKVRPTVFHSTSLRGLYSTLYKTISKKKRQIRFDRKSHSLVHSNRECSGSNARAEVMLALLG